MKLLVFGTVLMLSIAHAHAHDVDTANGNSLGSCASFGHSIGEAVWSWCANNEPGRMNACKASRRSWIEGMKRDCESVRRKHGCLPDRFDAVTWHVHGTESGRKLRIHRGVYTSCD